MLGIDLLAIGTLMEKTGMLMLLGIPVIIGTGGLVKIVLKKEDKKENILLNKDELKIKVKINKNWK